MPCHRILYNMSRHFLKAYGAAFSGITLTQDRKPLGANVTHTRWPAGRVIFVEVGPRHVALRLLDAGKQSLHRQQPPRSRAVLSTVARSMRLVDGSVVMLPTVCF